MATGIDKIIGIMYEWVIFYTIKQNKGTCLVHGIQKALYKISA